MPRMWGFWRRLHVELGTERGRREELTRRVESQQTTIAFLCQRVNQLETERALLFRQLTNINLPVPTLTVTPTAQATQAPANAASATLDAVASLGIFDDDARHAPAGWHEDGSVNYGTLPAPGPAIGRAF